MKEGAVLRINMADPNVPVLGFLIFSSLFEVCFTYNIDIQHPRVFQGRENTEFGFSSVFRSASSGLQLVIGAPKDNSEKRNGTGAVHICDVSNSDSCRPSYYITRPPRYSDSGVLYSDRELYGSMITVSQTGTTIVCAPRYGDLKYEADDYAFMIGRCTLNGSDSVAPVHGNPSTEYLKDETIGVGIEKQLFYKGMAQVGLSGDSLSDGSVVLGMPGFTEWRGGVVIYKQDMFFKEDQVVLDTPLAVPEFSYMGYSVVAGKFCGGGTCYATGAPRRDSGKVFIYLFVKSIPLQQLVQVLKGEQYGSYFGASVCAADVNGDGKDDLLVGAPQYTDMDETDGSKKVFADEGRVYVYLNQRTGNVNMEEAFSEKTLLKGSNINNARFGTSITNLGDVNKDGYDDVAIGAPYEDERRGVVYIYHGGPDGLQPREKQRIMAQDIDDTLTSFGWSISRPEDVDKNEYPDFAVGAYLSSKVVILRTRPIADVQVSITTDPKLIIQDESLCPSRVDSDGCFLLKICFGYTGASLPRNLMFNYTLSVDTRKSANTRRIMLLTDSDQVDSITKTIYTSDMGTCAQYQAISRNALRDKDPVTVVRLEAVYNLVLTANSSDIQPIVNPDTPRRVVKDIAFQRSCGEDNECWSDLSLQANTRVNHGTTEVRDVLKNSVVFNATKSIDLNIDVWNKGETAYATDIMITWTGSITFQSSRSSEQQILCNDKSAQIGGTSGRVECNVLTPVGEDTKFDYLMSFLADNPNTDMKTVDLHLSIDSQSNETDPTDNILNITTGVWIDADIKLKGKAEPEQIVISEEGREEKTVTILHNYLVTNRGPSYLPSTNLSIRIPVYIKPEEAEAVPEEQLISGAAVTITQDEQTIECIPSPEAEAVQKNRTTTTSGPVTSKMTTSGGNGGTTTLRPRPPSKMVDQPQAVQQQDSNVFILDCSTYLCERYVCSLYNLDPGKSVIADVNITVPAQNIPYEHFKEKSVTHLLYKTMSKVEEPRSPLFYPWEQAKELSIGTNIYPANPPTSVSLWIIIVSVIGGILLLFILFLVLYKCGFFKREKKGKIRKWKRESGYYKRNEPRTNRNSEAPRNSAIPEDINGTS